MQGACIPLVSVCSRYGTIWLRERTLSLASSWLLLHRRGDMIFLSWPIHSQFHHRDQEALYNELAYTLAVHP
ncbi:hypothetical protein BT93_L3453 [Corymbia citriodora subsp. variegata]|uniref:Uncharacterized protein n=1 Tax=Corymbia citriodora subsp. variegata TaxID=360336 RepID=A0A8T0CVI4_CORYI|nr:hypothetical protein BT93_L3453 [Corymbia citriodora subsp. variegata]